MQYSNEIFRFLLREKRRDFNRSDLAGRLRALCFLFALVPSVMSQPCSGLGRGHFNSVCPLVQCFNSAKLLYLSLVVFLFARFCVTLVRVIPLGDQPSLSPLPALVS